VEAKYLSSDELKTFIKEHKGQSVFVKDRRGRSVLAPWLLELRSRQARYVAERILGRPIKLKKWQKLWIRSTAPQVQPKEALKNPQMPNTATFGGFRLRQPKFMGIAKPQKKKSNRR